MHLCTEIIDRIDIVFHLQVITYLVDIAQPKNFCHSRVLIQICSISNLYQNNSTPQMVFFLSSFFFYTLELLTKHLELCYGNEALAADERTGAGRGKAPVSL